MTTYYVSSIDGDDTNAGTSSAAAFASLQAAADLVGPGDTVEVMNGTYTSASYGDALDITTSGTQDAPITFEAAAGQSPVIDSSGGWNAIKIEASNIVVSGFTVVGDAATISQSYALANADTGSAFLDGNGITITAGNGVSVPNHIVIENNQVYNEPGGGITSLDADYVTITNNNVHDNAHWSTYGNSGISVGASQNSDTLPGTHFVISGNTSTNNTELVPEYRAGAITDGEGIILDTNPNFVGNYLVEGNTTSGNSGPGIETFMTDNVTIDGNTTSGDLTNPNLASEGEIFVNQSNNNVVTNNSVTPNNDVPPSNAVPTDNSTSSAAPMSNELVLFVSEDAYQGDAEFTVAVNGTQVGGVYTTTALHSQGASQGFDLGTIVNGAIPYDLAVTFINDDFDGTPSTDRNLYVDSVEIDGQAVAGAAAPETGNGTVDFLLGGAAPTSTAASLPAVNVNSGVNSDVNSGRRFGADAHAKPGRLIDYPRPGPERLRRRVQGERAVHGRCGRQSGGRHLHRHRTPRPRPVAGDRPRDLCRPRHAARCRSHFPERQVRRHAIDGSEPLCRLDPNRRADRVRNDGSADG